MINKDQIVASLPRQFSFQESLQGHRVVMLGVFGGEQERDLAITCRLQNRLPNLRVLFQFGTISPLELLPPGGIVVEPFAQRNTRGEFFQPARKAQPLLLHATRP